MNVAIAEERREDTLTEIDPTRFSAASLCFEPKNDTGFCEDNYADPSVGAVVQQIEVPDFEMECGAVLPTATLGFCVYTANPQNPLIILHPALTGTARASLPGTAASAQGDGWWTQHIRPGGMLDPTKNTIVCVDHFGGNGGSTTGATLKKLGLHKDVTFGDGTNLLARVLHDRGVDTIEAVFGGSLGGGQAIHCLDSNDIHVKRIVEISGCSRANTRAKQYFQAVADLLWQERRPKEIAETLLYSVRDLTESKSPGFQVILDDVLEDLQRLEERFDETQALATSRKIGFLRFLTPAFFDKRIERQGGGAIGEAALKGWIQAHGTRFTDRFTADALATLSHMAANFKEIEPGDFAQRLVDRDTHFTGFYVDGDRLFHYGREKRFLEAAKAALPTEEQDRIGSIVVKDRLNGHDNFLNGGFEPSAFEILTTVLRNYDPVNEPRWKPEHIGDPIPASEFAISTAMTTAEITEGYERGEVYVTDQLLTGYPRFKLHPYVEMLLDRVKRDSVLIGQDKDCLVFPSKEAAVRCCDYLTRRAGAEALAIEPHKQGAVHAVVFDKELMSVAREYWQNAGEIVSARLAKSLLLGESTTFRPEPYVAVKKRIQELTGQQSTDGIFLFPTGMSAAHGALRLAKTYEQWFQGKKDHRPTLLFGYPYVDNFLLQDRSEAGVVSFMRGDKRDLDRAIEAIESGEVSNIVTELSRNPGLGTGDFIRLSKAATRASIPLIVDDTVGGYYNVDPFPYADIVYTSLSKSFAGTGEVMGGAVVVSDRKSYFYEHFVRQGALHFEQMCHSTDLEALEIGAQNYEERMERVNEIALRIAKMLHAHPAVEKVYYPYFDDRENYDQLKRERGGYGGLMSVALKNGEQLAQKFYNALEWNKGPGLGTDFSTACLINWLTHYHERDTFAEKYGMPFSLVRLSIGSQEGVELLEARLRRALDSLI